MLNIFSLKNHINFPTHQLQNTLDLIITHHKSSLISQTSQGSLLSDHNIIHYKLLPPDRIIDSKEIYYRELKAIDMDHLKEDISEIPHYGDCSALDEFVQLYNNSLTRIIDIHL